MHILSVAPILPYPPNHGWRVRTWHLLRALVLQHDVTLLTWTAPGETAENIRFVEDAVTRLIALPLGSAPRGALVRAMRQARFVFGGLPTYVHEMFQQRGLLDEAKRRAIDDQLRALDAAHPVDVVVFEEEAMKLMAPLPVRDAPVAVHRLEVFERLMRQLRSTSPIGRAYSTVEARRWGAFDREVLEGIDLIVSTSPETVDALKPYHAGLPITIVPNGVETRALRTLPGDAAATDVAVLGTMDYGPNVDGAIWFVHDVWPAIREIHPESRLRLVGRNPVRSIRDLASEDVIVTGEVPDVADACEGVRVGVVPLRSGMGIKNKTLDFMSMGLPVVSTPLGAEGVAAGPEEGLLVVDVSADALVGALIPLLANASLASARGAAARTYVEKRHSWSVIGSAYADALATLASGGRCS
jgi:glycosyltransferase involved in cell wall biosynthesis